MIITYNILHKLYLAIKNKIEHWVKKAIDNDQFWDSFKEWNGSITYDWFHKGLHSFLEA